MTYQKDPAARGKKAVYYAFLISPLIYIGLMFEMMYYVKWEAMFPFSEVFYLSLVYAFVMLVLPKQVKRGIWQKRKASIHTPQEFYTAFFAVSMIPIAMTESIAVIGLLVYFLTAEFPLPIGLCLITIFAVYGIIPKQAEIDERIREFHFEVDV